MVLERVNRVRVSQELPNPSRMSQVQILSARPQSRTLTHGKSFLYPSPAYSRIILYVCQILKLHGSVLISDSIISGRYCSPNLSAIASGMS